MNTIASSAADEQVFRSRFSRVLRTFGALFAVVLAYAAFKWLKFGRISDQLVGCAVTIPPFAYWKHRNTLVAVGPNGLRIKSPWSTEREPKCFTWSEITDAVVRPGRGSQLTVEVRSGSRFGWINYGVLADPKGLTEAVGQHAGKESVVYRVLASLGEPS